MIKFINSKGNEVVFTDNAPFILQKFEDNNNVNIYDSKSMSQDGRTYNSNTLDAKEISIQITILATDELDLNRKKQIVNTVFNPKFGELDLVYKDRKLKCIARSLPFFQTVTKKECVCLIDLQANNPYWLDTEEIKREIASWVGAFEFPLMVDDTEGIEMGYREPNLIVNVDNWGDVDCGMKIRFRATASVVNPSLFNVNTREYFNITKTMTSGEVIEITTQFQNKKVESILSGIKETLSEWDYTSTFLQLEVGDNLFRYDAETGLDNLEVDIFYTQQYLGRE